MSETNCFDFIEEKPHRKPVAPVFTKKVYVPPADMPIKVRPGFITKEGKNIAYCMHNDKADALFFAERALHAAT